MKIRYLLKRIRNRVYVIWPLLALTLLGVVLYWERMGIQVTQASHCETAIELEYATPVVYQAIDTVLLVDINTAGAETLEKEMELVLEDMRISFETKEISSFSLEELYRYDKLVLCVSDLNQLGEDITKLIDWVKNGGCMMNAQTYYADENFEMIKNCLGIKSGGTKYVAVSGLDVEDNFMIGATLQDFYFEEAYQFSHEVVLDEECITYIKAVDSGLPLLWERSYGEGKFVVANHAMTGKAARGFYAAAYRLLDEISVYPVINASVYYLDDFPSPVPSGEGKYIERDYGMDIADFYANIWWRDVLQWEEDYGIVHTGVIIEDYSDLVKAPFPRNESVEKFRFYGNMLLNAGGELGFHGYNHMPLCLEGFDYQGMFDEYHVWESKEDISQALIELHDFSKELFPTCTFQVYVPPSNILSLEGRAVLLETLPDIRAIASNYLPGACGYEQEFEIAKDGIAEMPRITSGLTMDDYDYLMMLSELNFHYVQNHFTHPDDVLDEHRGAALGWQTLKENFEAYLDFIYGAAPNLEDMTASEMANALQIYEYMTVKRHEYDKGVNLDIGGFCGKATFMLRVNVDEEIAVSGGTLEQLTEDIYLLYATQSHVEIKIGV